MSRVFEALRRSEVRHFGGVLATTPLFANQLVEAAENQRRNRKGEPDTCLSLPFSPAGDSRLASFTAKGSLAAERFRFLSVRLRQLRQQKTLRTLLITSASAGEGKSVVAANLAVSLAGQEQRVLLLEGNLRSPVLAARFGHPDLKGLGEWLRQDSACLPDIYCFEDPGFWLAPAGCAPERPLEFMQPERLKALLYELGARFDWIIIDCPALLPLADTSVWAELADAVLLTVRQGKSKERQLLRGLEALGQSELLGVVVNECVSGADESFPTEHLPGAPLESQL